MTAGDIEATAPPVVERGGFEVQIDANSTTPYQVVLSAPFTVG